MGVEKETEASLLTSAQRDQEINAGVEGEWDEFGDALEEAEVDERDPAKAREMKEKGNRCFQATDFEGAVECYTMAIRYCPYELPPEPRARRQHREKLDDGEKGQGEDGGRKDEGEDNAVNKSEASPEQEQQPEPEPFAEYKEELAVYYGNRAACYVSMELDKEAIDDCTAALRLKPNYIKVALRKAQACERLDRLEDALQEYKKALELDPSCHAAREKIPGLERAVAQRMEKLKEETLGKLKELGNSLLSGFGLSVDNFKMQQDPNSGSYSISFQK